MKIFMKWRTKLCWKYICTLNFIYNINKQDIFRISLSYIGDKTEQNIELECQHI